MPSAPTSGLPTGALEDKTAKTWRQVPLWKLCSYPNHAIESTLPIDCDKSGPAGRSVTVHLGGRVGRRSIVSGAKVVVRADPLKGICRNTGAQSKLGDNTDFGP